MSARRYNKGKIRYNLIEPFILKELAKVYTLGAHKYSLYKDENGNIIKGSQILFNEASNYELVESGADNWRQGLPISEILDSAQRHIEAFKLGEDQDELGSLHLANAMWNLGTAMYFAETKPFLDDRKKWWNNFPKIALDIDGVLAGLEEAYLYEQGYGKDAKAVDWNDPRFMTDTFFKLIKDEKFISLLPVIDRFSFPIVGYVTARGVSNEVSEKWLDDNLFPKKPVITVGIKGSKIEAIKSLGATVFVDDSIYNFMEINNANAGITCYLRTRDHNIKYDVGSYRINNLGELFNKLIM